MFSLVNVVRRTESQFSKTSDFDVAMTTVIKEIVSHNRRRYVDRDSGFNLDLTYITDNIIAMGFPAQKVQALFRNDIRQVKRLLDQRHPGKYKVQCFIILL